MLNNPMSGPAFIVALANALETERRPGAYTRPPPTGGSQISVRLGESLLAQLDVISRRAGWTRVQVLTALIERGLFGLYDLLSDEVGEAILDSITNELAPVMHNESLLLQEFKRLARRICGSRATHSPGNRQETCWIIGDRQQDRIPRLLVTIEKHAAEDFQNATHHAQKLMKERLSRVIEFEWRDAMEHAGKTNEPSLRITPETLTTDLSATNERQLEAARAQSRI